MSFLDPIMAPFLSMNPLLAIVLIAFLVSLLITVVTKYATNQEEMKRLKEQMKKFQKEMKGEKDTAKLMKLQKKTMELNMKYMKHSMRSTLITFIPIILIFGWLNSNMAYLPIHPGEEFTVTVNFEKGSTGSIELIPPEGIRILSENPAEINDSKAEWVLVSDSEVDALLQFKYDERYFDKEIKVTEGREYAPVIKKIKDPNVKSIVIGNEKLKPLNLFGWRVGWLGTYIIFSIVFSMLLRKLFRLH
ncbi:DUF106 domain-containing protein [Candidatus Woesearchaeota archaeon]|nr:MAG: DUF106 domain-containing protein [Candidatus Woesearchaeota archaeon]